MVGTLSRGLLKQLVNLFGPDRALTRPEDKHCYGFDASRLASEPGAVVFPLAEDEISALTILCADAGAALYPRGAGTGYVGGVTPGPVAEGVVCDFTLMNKMDPVDLDNAAVRVQPGVVTGKLQLAVEAAGLFYPPDPSSLNSCTIGGNIATNAGGPRCLKYGVTRRYVTALEVISASGEHLVLGRNLPKDVVGFDLRDLVIGSEGALALVTGISLSLAPLPKFRTTVEAGFQNPARAVELVSNTLRERILPAKIELMDRAVTACVEEFGHFGLPTNLDAIIGVELDGEPDSCQTDAETVAKLCGKLGAEYVRITPGDGARYWKARTAVSAGIHRLKPLKINEDVVVPRSKLPLAVEGIRKIGEQNEVTVLIFGHVGDGNIHTNFLWAPDELNIQARLEKALSELFALVRELGGSISGEHGVGLTKLNFVAAQLGPEALALNWKIKRIMDPKNILNPGKKLPPELSAKKD